MTARAESPGRGRENGDVEMGRARSRGRTALSRFGRVIGAVLALSALALAVLWHRCGMRGCPDVEALRGYMPDEASVVLDRDGNEITKLYITRRVVVPIDSIPRVAQDAFVAMEDRRYWEHDGVDWIRVAGALWSNMKSLKIAEGSSTITMQLARNMFPDKLPAKRQTIWRKLGEARVAKEIEERYTKDEILGLYLNQIYFGSGAYGIEAAAQEYFGVHAADLNLPQAALLAALPRAPSRYNPRSNPEAALEGRALVLDRMLEQGMITGEEAEGARAEGLDLRKERSDVLNRAPYFVEAVRRQLEDELGEILYTGGLAIHTTLDSEAQRVMEEEIGRQIDAIEAGRYGRFNHPKYNGERPDTSGRADGTPYLQVAGILMDAETGDILALVGGRDYRESQFNRATQAMRQPGSAFKPFVYAAALDAGIPATHRLEDLPIRMVLENDKIWEPKNYDDSYSGQVTLREGLVRSKNVVTVRLAEEVGLAQTVELAERMGVAPRLPRVPSVVLGTAEVTPLSLTAAYAPFATLGTRPEPRFVTRVTDPYGRTIWERRPASRPVLDPAVAFLTTSILEEVVDRGTGVAVRAVDFRAPAAGKTGTTQDAADVWFVGFTPDVVGTIWLGFDKRKTVLRGATGGELAAPVWGRVMRRLGARPEAWVPPRGVESHPIDAYGNVLEDGCVWPPPVRAEFFLRGTVPPAMCDPGYPDFGYPDTLGIIGGDTLPPDTTGMPESWRRRLRERMLRNDRNEMPVTPPTDTTLPGPPEPALPDSIVPDTIRAGIDVQRPGGKRTTPPARLNALLWDTLRWRNTTDALDAPQRARAYR